MRGFSFILATVKAQPAVLKMYASKSLQQLSEIGPLINPRTQAYTHIITNKNIDLLHIHNYRNVKSECIWRQNTVTFFFPSFCDIKNKGRSEPLYFMLPGG